MTRGQLITRLRVAGYHGDQAAFVRLVVENRIRFDVANRTFDEGRKLRDAGIRCDCYYCSKGKPR